MPYPRHLAIIMDGNGRWAKRRFLPRIAGHQQGVKSVRSIVTACIEQGVEVMTLFAFSRENWGRPEKEVHYLLQLFFHALKNDLQELCQNDISLRVVGELSRISPKMRETIREAEETTQPNQRLRLNIALDYSGQWDLTQAMRRIALDVQQEKITPSDITEAFISRYLKLQDAPDFLIRTGGDQRLSNFLLWPLAYTELYFTNVLWPDFGEKALEEAFAAYKKRERRFGLTPEQIGIAPSRSVETAIA